jgi:peptide/nickel transport system substrate-binding protein
MKKLLALGMALLMSTSAIGTASAQATNNNPLSDVRVRQALAYAIDMQTIIDTIFDGNAIKAVGMLPNGPFKNPDLNPYDYNPDKARELLKEAGWDSSRTLEMVYYYDDQITANLMQALQAYFADVGINMNARLLTGDVAKTLGAIPPNPTDKSLVSWDLGYGARAAIVMQEYYNDYATGKASSDQFPGTPEMDAAIAATNASIDPEKQKEAFFAIEKLMNDNVYTVPLYYQQLFTVESDRLNRNGAPYGNEQFNYNWDIQNWTVEPDASGKHVFYTNGAPVDYFEHPWANLGLWVGNRFVFDRLLFANPTMTGIAGGDLAESYTVSDDGKTVTLTLRDNIKWHDGEPITVDDVTWSFEAALFVPNLHGVVGKTLNALEGAADYVAKKAEHISGISTEGNTITLKFATLDPNVLISLSQFAPLPKKYFEGTDPTVLQQNAFWQKPVGSGPFKVDTVAFGDYASLLPFDDYFLGKPKIEQVVAFASADGDVNMVKNAAANRIDFAITKVTSDVKALKDMPHMKLTPMDIPYTRMMWINTYDK